MSSSVAASANAEAAELVDNRGLRFVAAVTTFVLTLALVAGQPYTVILVALQAVVFAVSAFCGVRYSPYALVFQRVVRPRLTSKASPEDARPPRFAQGVGLVFAVTTLVAFALGAEVVAYIAIGFAWLAAFLNAAVGLCLGCELYLILRRLNPAH